MNVHPTLGKHAKTVMAIENSPIRPGLERTPLAWHKRRFQIAGRDAAKEIELDSNQIVIGMQEFQFRLWWELHLNCVVLTLS